MLYIKIPCKGRNQNHMIHVFAIYFKVIPKVLRILKPIKKENSSWIAIPVFKNLKIFIYLKHMLCNTCTIYVNSTFL